MTVLNFVLISRDKEVFFFRKKKPRCWQGLNKFYESVIEIFGDEFVVAINTVKSILMK